MDAVNPLAPKREDHIGGTLQKAIYPIARYFNAVDLIITNAGYNSFHECIYGGIPAIFVPNEAPEMDEQAVRAAYAQSSGLGLCLRSVDVERAHEVIELALSEDFLAQHRTRAGRIVFANGAREAALAIEELVFSVRTDRALGDRLRAYDVFAAPVRVCWSDRSAPSGRVLPSPRPPLDRRWPAALSMSLPERRAFMLRLLYQDRRRHETGAFSAWLMIARQPSRRRSDPKR
ncbi:glycosyltransferase [Rhizobium beringeri]